MFDLFYLQNITKEQAIKEHRKMWNWIANESLRIQGYVNKKDYVSQFISDKKAREFFSKHHFCFCCLYASGREAKTGHMCVNCPLDWDSTSEKYMCEYDVPESLNGLYSRWCNCECDDYIEASRLAREIANLPESIHRG